MKAVVATAAILAAATSAAGRTFTVTNHCPFTIWPAIFTTPGSPGVPDHPTGWEQGPDQSVSFSVPDNWSGGHIWGRRNCDFSSNPGASSCLTGGCDGGLECSRETGTGVPPITTAEFNLDGGVDVYEISLVDGFNLPMIITNSKGCGNPECTADINGLCPDPLKGPTDGSGARVGCMSACVAGLGDPVDSTNCCTGSHSTPLTCPASGVEFYRFFKDSCPQAFAYVYDDGNGALFRCAGDQQADYTITFCP